MIVWSLYQFVYQFAYQCGSFFPIPVCPPLSGTSLGIPVCVPVSIPVSIPVCIPILRATFVYQFRVPVFQISLAKVVCKLVYRLVWEGGANWYVKEA